MLQSPAQILEAAPDALALAMGASPRNPHPQAGLLAREGAMSNLSYVLGTRHPRARADDRPDVVQAYGMRSAEFGNLLAEAAANVAARRFADLAAHRSFSTLLAVPNYLPQQLPGTADVDIDLPLTGEVREIKQFTVKTTEAGTAQVRRYMAMLGITAEVIRDDAAGAVAAAVGSAASAIARIEGKLVYGALEANPTLQDGAPTFHTDLGNVIEAALDASTLAQAVAALRNQRTPGGQAADLPAAHLVVSPGLEFAAGKLVHEAGASIGVIATTHLPEGRWYVFAAPSVSPTVAVLTLDRTAPTVRIDATRENLRFDGATLTARANLGAAILGRIGVIRGGDVGGE